MSAGGQASFFKSTISVKRMPVEEDFIWNDPIPTATTAVALNAFEE